MWRYSRDYFKAWIWFGLQLLSSVWTLAEYWSFKTNQRWRNLIDHLLRKYWLEKRAMLLSNPFKNKCVLTRQAYLKNWKDDVRKNRCIRALIPSNLWQELWEVTYSSDQADTVNRIGFFLRLKSLRLSLSLYLSLIVWITRWLTSAW